MENKTATLVCERHGNATPLTCVRCQAPICWGCLVETDVGFMCERHGGRARRPQTLPAVRRERLVLGAGSVVVGVLLLFAVTRLNASGDGPPAPQPVVYQVLPDLPFNAGFEGGSGPSGVPVGWEIRGGDVGVLDAEITHSGAASGRLRAAEGDLERRRTPPGMFSCFGAEPVAGRTLRLRAFVRSEDATGSLTGLVIEVFGRGPGGRSELLAAGTMRSFPISGTTGWEQHNVQVPVAKVAERVCVGALITGRGTLWIDDLGLEHSVGGPALP